MYGGNASGKTNMVEAIAFAQSLVLRTSKTDRPLAVEPFLLDGKSLDEPTRFTFELLAGGTLYEYGFSLTREAVVEEKLTEITGSSERSVFSRSDGRLALGSPLEGDERLRFAFAGTDANQLFVNNAVSQKLDTFRPVYDWFQSLHVIGPHTHFGPCRHFVSGDHPLFEAMNDMLSQLDTGITQLGGSAVLPDDIGLPESLREKLEQNLSEGETSHLTPPGDKSPFIVTRQGGSLSVYKQVAHHTTVDGTDTVFDLDDESDGSRRLIDLLPPFLSLAAPGSDMVLVVDEIDRSLHTLLIRRLLEWYLDARSADSRAQLLFTTHDVLLMDQALFRRDEMWVAERDVDGASRLFALSDYQDIRYDKDIRKSYLQGRLGGIPRILLSVTLPTVARA
jgi:AAA15 family ATPase/GTPase